MTTIQKFSPNDPIEDKIIQAFADAVAAREADQDAFYEGAYETYALGEVLYDLDRDPLTGVITRDVYRKSYPALHELFTRPGTFEFYLSVFRRIFTEDTDIQFSIPGPGQLHIEINALTLETFNILVREVVDGEYVYHNLVTSDFNEPIIGTGVTGIKTQEEIEGLINEISAYGIYTTIELVTSED